MSFRVLDSGSCEGFKGSVHGAALGLAVLMGLYNAAAWLRRREQHLAVNAVLYTAITVWEYKHVLHHCQPLPERRDVTLGAGADPQEPPRAA